MAVTARQRVFSAVAFDQYRLLVRAEKTDDDRLLNLTIGLGFLAGNIRAKETDACRTVLQRIAAHAAGWVEEMGATGDVFALIHAERERQEHLFIVEKKFLFTCASPTAGPKRKLRVLVEEIGEVAQAIDKLEAARPAQLSTLNSHLSTELVQVAAVCVAWLESLEVQS